MKIYSSLSSFLYGCQPQITLCCGIIKFHNHSGFIVRLNCIIKESTKVIILQKRLTDNQIYHLQSVKILLDECTVRMYFSLFITLIDSKGFSTHNRYHNQIYTVSPYLSIDTFTVQRPFKCIHLSRCHLNTASAHYMHRLGFWNVVFIFLINLILKCDK